MDIQIDATAFLAACAAAGVTDYRFVWGSDGLLFFPDDYPADQKTTVEAEHHSALIAAGYAG